jgi:hypothetical protein
LSGGGDIEVPPALRGRPRWNGYIVPWIQYVDPAGRPDFRVLDVLKHTEALMERLCGLCGRPIRTNEWVVFIGGEKAIASRSFIDPGMHEACALYATKVCPYLAQADATHRVTGRRPAASVLVANPHAAPGQERPARMGMYYCRKYRVLGGPRVLAGRNPSQIRWDAMPCRTEG